MASEPATAGWEQVENSFYRKIQLYSSIWDDPTFDLDDYHVAGAPFGGAIALYRNEAKIKPYRPVKQKPSVDIYNSAGKLYKQIPWDKGTIKGLGWSEDEKLLVISQDGTVRCYFDFQGNFSQFSLGNGAETIGVRECRFWNSGFVALLNNNRLVAVSRYDEPRPKLLADPGVTAESPIHSWTIIPPAYTLSGHVEVLLAVGKTLLVVDATEVQDQMMDQGPFTHVAVSPHGKYFALHSDDGKVWVISSDFQRKLSEVDTGMGQNHPLEVVWCGNDSVVLAWEDAVQMVGPRSVALRYFYEGRVHVIPDIDGVRLLSQHTCEFLQKVPDLNEDIHKLGSTSPAAILLDAIDHLENESPKADDDIQLIRSNLAEAVDSCTKAAGHEFNVHWQKQLLKAASFGKSVLELYSSDQFVEMCEILRVLNAVRFYEIGMPLTIEQYKSLSPERLIQRLINRQEYLLALRISDYLKLPTDRIYVNWACRKVRISTDDEDSICRTVVERLKGKGGVSFEEIARTAFDEGRGRLATQLLNYEPRAGKQVPLLMSMEEDELALDKAIESGDTDLVSFVLMHLKKKLPLAQFFRVVNPRPVAYSLVESEAREQDRGMLRDLYYQDDRRGDGALVILEESLNQEDLKKQIDKLTITSKLLKDSKPLAAEAKAIDESIKLLQQQEALESALMAPYLHLSLHDTISHLLKANHTAKAQRLASDFKVPDRTYTWLRLRALISRRDWGALEDWVKGMKKSPIGWEPFFEECIAARNLKVASMFVPKIGGVPRERIDRYIRCQALVMAAHEAVKINDAVALENILGKAKGPERAEIERIIANVKK